MLCWGLQYQTEKEYLRDLFSSSQPVRMDIQAMNQRKLEWHLNRLGMEIPGKTCGILCRMIDTNTWKSRWGRIYGQHVFEKLCFQVLLLAVDFANKFQNWISTILESKTDQFWAFIVGIYPSPLSCRMMSWYQEIKIGAHLWTVCFLKSFAYKVCSPAIDFANMFHLNFIQFLEPNLISTIAWITLQRGLGFYSWNL